MVYKATPNSNAVVIWALIFILVNLILYLDNTGLWDWLLLAANFILLVFRIVWMYFVSYKVENTTLHISSSPYWKSELDLNKLISVKKRENGGLKRFFGMPKTTIELYMERDGHMELWTDNEKLFESLKAFERAGNTSLYTSRLSG